MACQYLDKTSSLCTLVKGGVFIPLQAHCDQFCCTANFTACTHFRNFAGATEAAAEPGGEQSRTDGGRRRSVRKEARFAVRLFAGDRSGDTGMSGRGDHAYTVDISAGGMRIRGAEWMARHRELRFTFGDDFVVPHLQGTAAVRWHRTSPGEGGQWEAGLAFQDPFVQTLLAAQMAQ